VTALFAAAAGLGAMLLFQVQLVLGKRLLPWFGGTSALWTTCLLFFQSALLAGYGWAHLLAGRASPRRQRDLHLLLLASALLALAWHALPWPSPITPGDASRPLASDVPVLAVLGRLVGAVGLPFVALAATSPLLQAWLARARPEASPFWVFALSNAGSLAGLVSYPFVVEPYVSLTRQGWLWSAGFLVQALLVSACALLAAREGGPRVSAVDLPTGAVAGAPPPAAAPAKPTVAELAAPASVWLWLALSAVPSLLLLAVTSHLTQEVAAVPLLWMLPLAVYLATFVVCFGWPAATARIAWGPLAAAAGILAVIGLQRALVMGARGRTVLWLAVLLAYSMACHGELVRARPGPRRLTVFYLAVAAGGALGGVVSALVAPFVLDGYWELHASILAGPLVLALTAWQRPERGDEESPGRMRLATAAAVYGLALAGWLVHDVVVSRGTAEVVRRGFYGALRVVREARGTSDESLKLMHGRIAHGLQLVDPARRTEPTTYFGPASGVGLAIRRHPRRLRGEPLRIGIVGLGVGTLAAWSRSGDVVRFYELDPEVARLSQAEPAVFTYLRDAAGDVSVVVGDGRLSLEREPPAGYDVLVLDAFSSDAIPAHLLTREAFSVYLRHLRADGVLAVQVTNRYVDLKPVVRGAAAAASLRALHVPSFERGVFWSSDWMLVGRGGGVLDDELVSAASLPRVGGPADTVWADDWSDLVSVLRR
jgi:hypothetical protein